MGEQEKDSDQKRKFPMEIKSIFPMHRQQVLNPNGWGYSNTYFKYENGNLVLKGNAYKMCNIPLRNARSTFLEILNYDVKDFTPYTNPMHSEKDYPPRIENAELIEDLKGAKIEFSVEFADRLLRSHGQAPRDFYILRYGKFKRIPDLVVWPKCHEDVVRIVELANKFLCVIIPYGGGTNVTLSLSYAKTDSKRLFISLDTSLMNRIMWIDETSMLACVEAGIAGGDLRSALEKLGYVMGHEPDSLEFSTLGGWVATRSSGIMQQAYGNIEDIVSNITLVTSVGVMEKSFIAPRSSIGPDYDQLIIGSEGTLGVITKVVMKIHKLPAVRRYGAIIFPDLESGVKFLYDVSKFPHKPASIRLVDNLQYQFGQAMMHSNYFGYLMHHLKRFALPMLFGYDIKKISFVTYLIEGDEEYVDKIESKLGKLPKKFNGMKLSSSYGEQGYTLTFTICYTRDFFFDMGFFADSMEPSVSWTNCMSMINAINDYWENEKKRRDIFMLLSLRISQIYNSGVCVYFYYGIGPIPGENQLEVLEELAEGLKSVIIAAGGNVSHHHGIGKKNSKYYPSSVSRVGVDIFRAIKKRVDPNNVFDAGNFTEDKNGAKL